jgi:RNA polymerase sigma factor (sigma-70 family)
MLETLEDFVYATRDRNDAESVKAIEELVRLTNDVVRIIDAQPADREDLASQIFLIFFTKVTHGSTVDLKAPIGPWLTTVARNLFISALRKKGSADRYVTAMSLLGYAFVNSDAFDEVAKQEAVERLTDEIGKLKEFEKSLIVYRSIQGLPWNEVAEIMKSTCKSEGTLRRDHSRVVKKLKAKLEKQR